MIFGIRNSSDPTKPVWAGHSYALYDGTAQTSWFCSAPAAAAPGDMLLAVVRDNASMLGNINSHTGWAQENSIIGNESCGVNTILQRALVLSRQASGTSEDDLTVNFSATKTGMIVVVLVKSANSVDVDVGCLDISSDTIFTFPSFTSDSAGKRSLLFGQTLGGPSDAITTFSTELTMPYSVSNSDSDSGTSSGFYKEGISGTYDLGQVETNNTTSRWSWVQACFYKS